MHAEWTLLDDRAVLDVSGPDARAFLQRLVTNDVETLGPDEARYAALLTPQGKITSDFFVTPGQDGALLIDAPAVNAAELVKKLTLYRLRAKVTIADRSQHFAVVAFAGPPAPAGTVHAYADPRASDLWSRGFVERDARASGGDAGRHAYDAQRIRAGVPEGGLDFVYGETFPHEANLDHLNGVDFRKGCYVGQEVVSRVQHRGTARKRIVKAFFDGAAPPIGAEIIAEGIVIGSMGSSSGGLGLAMVRLDRLGEMKGVIEAGGVALRLEAPAWAA